MSPDYLGAWVVGLLGAGHCLGMCGGISALLTL
ncbi:TPA: sulfite exporter TauE/SafE family protein, partial [Vibrio cholerae O1]